VGSIDTDSEVLAITETLLVVFVTTETAEGGLDEGTELIAVAVAEISDVFVGTPAGTTVSVVSIGMDCVESPDIPADVIVVFCQPTVEPT
jgi:hypothetical protein